MREEEEEEMEKEERIMARYEEEESEDEPADVSRSPEPLASDANRESVPVKVYTWSPYDTKDGATKFKRLQPDSDALEDDDVDSELPQAKRARSSSTTPSPQYDELLEEAREESKALQEHIEELYTFIENSGMMLKAPAPIRQRLDARENGAAILAKALKDALRKACDDICGEDNEKFYSRKCNSDDLSQAVEPYVDDIRSLSQFPQTGSVRLAMDVLLYLGEMSYGDMDSSLAASGYGERDSDLPADLLMCELLRRRRGEDPSWKYGPVLKELAATSEYLSKYGIDTYFTRTLALMRGWDDRAAVNLT